MSASLRERKTCPLCGSDRLGMEDLPDLLGETLGTLRASCVDCDWQAETTIEFP